jgi:hypothetical protein
MEIPLHYNLFSNQALQALFIYDEAGIFKKKLLILQAT